MFPDDVQAHLATYPGVQSAEVVGVPHRIFDEGIFAFVQPRPGVELTAEEILEHAKSIASYKRPQHVEIWPSNRVFPMNRLGKVDKQALHKVASEIVETLRATGQWDVNIDKMRGLATVWRMT